MKLINLKFFLIYGFKLLLNLLFIYFYVIFKH